jgi:hypothetical protein
MTQKRRTPPPPLKSNTSTMKIMRKPSMTQSLADGFMFGAGSSLGRHAVNSILATSPSSTAPTSTPTPVSTDKVSSMLPEIREAECMKYIRQYEYCLGEIDTTCQEYMDKIQKYCN